MGFIWNKDTITGEELMQELINQYGASLNIDIEVDPKKQYKFNSAYIKFSCNRCGKDGYINPSFALTALDNRTPLCTKCANMNDEELKEYKRNLMLEEANKIAIENGEINVVEEEPIETTKYNAPEVYENIEDLMAKTSEENVNEELENKEEIEEQETKEKIEEEKIEEESSEEEIEEELSEQEIEEESPEEEIEEEEIDEEQFPELYKNALEHAFEALGFAPFDSKFNINEEGGIDTKCSICNTPVHFNNFEEISNVVELEINGKIKYNHNCPNCINSIKQYGYVDKFKNYVKNFIEKRGVKIINENNYIFNSPTEEYELSCEGITFNMSIHQFIKKYSNIQDLRPMFRQQAEEKAKAKLEAEEKNNEKSINTKTKENISNQSNMVYKTTIQGAEKGSDTLEMFESEREEQRKAAQEKMVFKDDFAKIDKSINPFSFEPSLFEEFSNSCFAPFLEDLKRFTNTDYTIIINEETLEIPFIDFETGLRIICFDLDDKALYHINLANRALVPKFSYKEHMNSFKFIILYSDSVRYRRTATLNNLTKIINPSVLPYGNKRINLQENFTVMYTNNNQFIKEFEEKNNIFPMGKPRTGSLGLLAQNDVSKKKGARAALDFAAMLEYGKRGFKLNDLTEEYETYMVASIRYIEIYNKDKNSVNYIITDYTEVGSSFIADGLYLLVGALIKEYNKKYPNLMGIPPTIIFERDPNNIPSMSISYYIEKGSLVELSPMNKFMFLGETNFNGYSEEHVKQYIKLPEMRNKEEDAFRHDIRIYNTQSLIARFGEEIKNAGIANSIRDPGVRKQFIKNLGYEKCNIMPIKEYLFEPTHLFGIMTNSTVLMMQQLPDVESLMPIGGIVNDAKMNMNPFMMMKFMQLMNDESASQITNELFNKFMMQQFMGSDVDMNQYMNMMNMFNMS